MTPSCHQLVHGFTLSDGAVGFSTTPDFCRAFKSVSMFVVFAIDGRPTIVVAIGRTMAEEALGRPPAVGSEAGLATAGGGALTTDVAGAPSGGAPPLTMASRCGGSTGPCGLLGGV